MLSHLHIVFIYFDIWLRVSTIIRIILWMRKLRHRYVMWWLASKRQSQDSNPGTTNSHKCLGYNPTTHFLPSQNSHFKLWMLTCRFSERTEVYLKERFSFYTVYCTLFIRIILVKLNWNVLHYWFSDSSIWAHKGLVLPGSGESLGTLALTNRK